MLAALTIGPALVVDWFPPGRYGPLAILNDSGTKVIHHVWLDVAQM